MRPGPGSLARTAGARVHPSVTMIHALVGALLLGAVSTLGDFLWAALHLRHRVGYGLAHGAVVCLCVGAVIGWRARRAAFGAVAGVFIGVAAAGLFYLLAPALRYGAMFPAWMFFWICFAFLQSGLEGSRSPTGALIRGAASAVLSGLAFYMISGIWTRPTPGGPDYLRNFLSWSFAFLPGFLALFTRKNPQEQGRTGVT
jgi:hypothetical protein